MPFSLRVSAATLGALFLIGSFGLAALAQEEPSEPTSTEPATTVTVPEPAVSVVEEPPPAEDQEWTTVYLVPTALVIGAGTVLITIVMYFFRVTRARYRPQV